MTHNVNGKDMVLFLPWILMIAMLAGCNGSALDNGEARGQTIVTSIETEESQEPAMVETVQDEAIKIKAQDVSSFFDGASKDQVRMEDYGYLVGERYVLYFDKDTSFPGDLKRQIEEIMLMDEQVLGISFSVTDFVENKNWLEVYYGDVFRGIPKYQDKIHVMLAKDENDGAIPWTDGNEIMLFDSDFDPNYSSREMVYHEIAHALRLRHSLFLGKVLEEGIGVYAQYHVAQLLDTPCWCCIQFLQSSAVGFDEAAVVADPEGKFREYNLGGRSKEQLEYQYGFRLITFLMEEYGNDVIQRLSTNAAKYQFSEEDNDVIILILKETTSEDVFERFAAWLPEGWKRTSEDIENSLKKYGY